MFFMKPSSILLLLQCIISSYAQPEFLVSFPKQYNESAIVPIRYRNKDGNPIFDTVYVSKSCVLHIQNIFKVLYTMKYNIHEAELQTNRIKTLIVDKKNTTDKKIIVGEPIRLIIKARLQNPDSIDIDEAYKLDALSMISWFGDEDGTDLLVFAAKIKPTESPFVKQL